MQYTNKWRTEHSLNKQTFIDSQHRRYTQSAEFEQNYTHNISQDFVLACGIWYL